MTKLALISTAHIHTDGFLKSVTQDIADAGCVAIWDDVPERGQSYAEKYGVPFIADLDAVLADERIDGFVVCAENTRHLPLLEKVLPVGKPTLCEKPLATTTADAERIAALQQAHGGVLMSGYFQPFFGHHRAVVRELAADTLGKITHARFVNAHHAAYGRWFDKPALRWFTDPDLAGGGALMDMGTHALHLLLHFFGPVKRVWARVDNLTGEYPAVDDSGLMLLDFQSGVLGRVEASWCYTGNQRGLEIVGRNGAIVTTPDDTLTVVAPGKPAETLAAADPRPDRMRRLVAACKGELTREELAEDLVRCLDAVKVMDAAYRSAKSGAWVAM